MPEPWWRANPQDLYQVEDRITSIYVEHCHVDRDDNAVVLVNRQKTVRVPALMVTVLLIGPGTRIIHAAVTLLDDSGTAMRWVGSNVYTHMPAEFGGPILSARQVR